MIDTDSFFELLVVPQIWYSTRTKGPFFWKKEVPYDTPYSTSYLVCRVCGLKITVWSNSASDLALQPKDMLTFKEVHALRHQMAGEFPPVREEPSK